MKLVRLYCNRSEVFLPIVFNEGLSVILASVTAEPGEISTGHNLGKSTVARIVDFCLLKRRDKKFFLFKHDDLFSDFVFYLEIMVGQNSYVTIARAVDGREPISIITSSESISDALFIPDSEWDLSGVGLTAAVRWLDSYLDWNLAASFTFRNALGYFLREQGDYGQVFQLGKFRGAYSSWKPFLQSLMGFPVDDTLSMVAADRELEGLDQEIEVLRREVDCESEEDFARLELEASEARRRIEQVREALSSLNFAREDRESVGEIVGRLDTEIVRLNDELFYAARVREQVELTLGEGVGKFNLNKMVKLFEEAGIAFQSGLRKEFEDLVAFNRAITVERTSYLDSQLKVSNSQIEELERKLESVQARRAELLASLWDSSALGKYQEMSRRLVELEVEFELGVARGDRFLRLSSLEEKVSSVTESIDALRLSFEMSARSVLEDPASRFSLIRNCFAEIIDYVLGERVDLVVNIGEKGFLDFAAAFVDESGVQTSAADGFTYHKLLCVAFDLAVLRSYRTESFGRFVIHDGVFESLSPSAKRKLLSILRDYAAFGLQIIITSLESDYPLSADGSHADLDPEEVICSLHDRDESGRLFRMKKF